jgi:CheY-like chemotaxis protein
MAQKILVIDDAPATARLVDAVLQQSFPGCDVLSASRGSDGCERLHMTNPDVVLLNDTLPDMGADAVLARLQADPANAQVPVFLLVDPANGNEFNGRYPNVARVLTKPVAPEALRDALTEILGNKASARRVLPSRGGIVFSGHTGFISLRQALHMAQSDRLTGVLRFQLGRHPIELWMNGGRFLFATTKNVQLYCNGSPVILSATTLGLILESQLNQQVTGCPIFLFLSARNGFPHDDVVQITRDHGQRLFGQLFTSGRIAFEFEETDRLPDYVKNVPPSNDDPDNFILAALRHVRFEQLAPNQRPDPNGDPAYTRRGYDLIQRLKLNDVEARFATAISGTDTLQAIAQKIGVPLADALLVVFRFIALDIIDFWNPGVLTLPASSQTAAAS